MTKRRMPSNEIRRWIDGNAEFRTIGEVRVDANATPMLSSAMFRATSEGVTEATRDSRSCRRGVGGSRDDERDRLLGQIGGDGHVSTSDRSGCHNDVGVVAGDRHVAARRAIADGTPAMVAPSTSGRAEALWCLIRMSASALAAMAETAFARHLQVDRRTISLDSLWWPRGIRYRQRRWHGQTADPAYPRFAAKWWAPAYGNRATKRRDRRLQLVVRYVESIESHVPFAATVAAGCAARLCMLLTVISPPARESSCRHSPRWPLSLPDRRGRQSGHHPVCR